MLYIKNIMPRFVDNSYVMRDVKKMQKDIEDYHNQNQNRIYNELKQVFLTRELDTYDQVDKLVKTIAQLLQNFPASQNDLSKLLKQENADETTVGQFSEKLHEIWEGYRGLVAGKQFFIRDECKDINSIEALLDLCNKKGESDKEDLHKYIKDKFEEYDMNANDDIRELYDTLVADDYMDSRIRPFYRNYQDFVLEKMSHRYEKLYKNFAGIFFKVINKTMDMDRLEHMLNMVKNIETGRVTQHNASVKIGQELGNQYLKNFK